MMHGVQPGGHALVFYVPSSREGHEPHQVHLGAYGGNGVCNCENFVYRIRDLLEHGGAAASDGTRCRHIKIARAALLDDVIARLGSTGKISGDEHDSKDEVVRRRPPKADSSGSD